MTPFFLATLFPFALCVAVLLYLLRAAWVRELDLRRENERLLARIGWEYHISSDRPHIAPSDIPDVPSPFAPFFRMKPDPRFIQPNPTPPSPLSKE